ncbi:hypothetical protein [Agrococcus sediminis]
MQLLAPNATLIRLASLALLLALGWWSLRRLAITPVTAGADDAAR